MRIVSSDTAVGYPILLIRRVLRSCQAGDLVVGEAERILAVDPAEARRVIGTLESEGYLELYTAYLPHE